MKLKFSGSDPVDIAVDGAVIPVNPGDTIDVDMKLGRQLLLNPAFTRPAPPKAADKPASKET